MLKVFPAHLNNLYEMLAFICEQARKFKFKEVAIQQVELACEEALVNIIQHGYLHVEGEISIECLFLDTQGIMVIIRDAGVPFNPILNANALLNPLESESVGGYGIHLILNLMDKVTYVRENSSNKLTLIKYKSSSTTPS